MKHFRNEMTLTFSAIPENEAFARNAVAAFCVCLDPTIDEINDIKTAVSEAVTNAVVHAYSDCKGEIKINTVIEDGRVHIAVMDTGVGIVDIDKAMQPFFTTKPDDERSGMGFTVMESFTDSLNVAHNTPSGTIVSMEKAIRGACWKEKKSSN